MLFSCLVGTGVQIVVASFLVIIFAIIGELYIERGSLLSTTIFVYAVSSPVNGNFIFIKIFKLIKKIIFFLN